MNVDELISKGRAKLDKVEPLDIPNIDLADEPITVRFWPMTGPQWREFTAQHPSRNGVTVDQSIGYNIDAVLREYPKVFLVDGDEVVNVTTLSPKTDPSDPDHRKWYDIVSILDAPDLKDLAIALWGLHEFAAQKRQAALGKASAGGWKKKPS